MKCPKCNEKINKKDFDVMVYYFSVEVSLLCKNCKKVFYGCLLKDDFCGEKDLNEKED